jgi:hypothetical protein
MPRASGQATVAHVAVHETEGIDKPEELVLAGEPSFRTPKFMRMRFNWGDEEERQVIRGVHDVIQAAMIREFTECYRILTDIQDIVRTPQVNKVTGEILKRDGATLWELTPSGYPVEDYSRLTNRQIENFLGTIATRLFAWEQSSARMWTDAMMAKARFEERFAIAYGESGRRTVDDRTAAGNEDAAEERYHAIFLTGLSRRADALVRSMDRLQTRLKDIMVSR